MKQILMLKFFFFLFLLSSCSSMKGTQSKSEVTPDDGAWIYEVEKGCPVEMLCASAGGKDQEEADTNAKKSLASIFETKINAQFRFVKNYIDNKDLSEVRESVIDEVNTQVDQVLKGAEIIKRFEKDGLIFSLVALDKNKSSQLLRQELTRIDDEMTHYFHLRNRIYLKKLVKLYNQREILNEKLTLISNQSIARKVTFSEINDLKYDEQTKLKIFLKMSESVPRILFVKVKNALTDIGHEIVSSDAGDVEISVDFKKKEEFLNVKGFKKYSYSLSLESYKKSKQKVGGFSLDYVANGRDDKNAFLKVRNKFLKEIDENLDKLNLNMR